MIVTEWPMQSTVANFWSMVYDHDCSTVVVLNNPPIPGKVTRNNKSFVRFWPEDGYSNNIHCEWFMEMPKNSLIYISYSDFNLESSSDNACSADYLLIRNDIEDAAGPVSTLPIMAKQCGTTIPPNLLLRGNRLLLVFHSNHENNYRGFKMNYEITKEGFQISNLFH